jgi:hypothetical protein
MPAPLDLIGKKFNRLTVIGRTRHANGRVAWVCKCDCGNESIVLTAGLRSGQTVSCGCYALEDRRKKGRNKTHGMSKTPIYQTWAGMIDRCFNKNDSSYKNYGGRGITVCDRWRRFDYFYKDMGEKPKGMTIERKDVNGNYEPENCMWADRTVQNQNRRNVKKHMLRGQLLTVKGIANETGMKYSTVYYRISRGIPLE